MKDLTKSEYIKAAVKKHYDLEGHIGINAALNALFADKEHTRTDVIARYNGTDYTYEHLIFMLLQADAQIEDLKGQLDPAKTFDEGEQ